MTARRDGEQSVKESEQYRALGDEIADVLWVLRCVYNQTGVDLNEALMKIIRKKTQRDKERHKQNEKL